MKTLKLNSRVLSMAVASILAVGVGAFSVNSYAGTNTSTLDVSADIQATCQVSTTAVTFSHYDPVGVNKTADLEVSNGKVTMTCTTGAAPKVGLNLGLNAVSTQRYMISGANTLAYNLYQPGGFTTAWGFAPGTDTVAGVTGDGASHDLVINASIPMDQNKPTGTYADTVTVLVTF